MWYLKVFLLAIAFGLTASAAVLAQDTVPKPQATKPILRKDTTATVAKGGVVKDSARLALEKLPGVAVRRSAIIPGWGQVTNGRWWKVPIIYGGFVGLALAVDFNQRYYKQFLRELQYRNANNGAKLDPELAIGDNQALIQYKDYYRRNRDLSVLASVGLYAINMIDAYVDAKFFRFDISDKLGLQVKPTLMPAYANAAFTPAPAFKIQLSL